jgi:hypothetical protein
VFFAVGRERQQRPITYCLVCAAVSVLGYKPGTRLSVCTRYRLVHVMGLYYLHYRTAAIASYLDHPIASIHAWPYAEGTKMVNSRTLRNVYSVSDPFAI